MKTNDPNKFPRKLNNHGFSLVELIISIAILAIIMIPLMNNFFRSMQMNKKAEELQVKSNVASNIMEGLKILPIQKIQEQFSSVGSFNIINNSIDEVKRLYYNTATTEYQDNPPIMQAPYYFTIHGIKEGSTAYDALITMDPTPYNDIDPVDDIMNDYLMPDVINLDNKSNGLLITKGDTATDDFDNDALTTYCQWGEVYAESLFLSSSEYSTYLDNYSTWQDNCEKAEMEGLATPAPIPIPSYTSSTAYDQYYKSADVVTYITKTMRISLSTNTKINDTIKYQIEYSCAWPSGSTIEESIIYPVSSKQYPDTINNIYLFYTPSVFQVSHIADKIIIENAGGTPLNLHIAKQSSGGVVLTNNIEIHRSTDSDNVSVFTDITGVQSYIAGMASGTVNNEVIKTNQKNRIYDIKVEIYEYVNSSNITDRYKKKLYTLESTNGE